MMGDAVMSKTFRKLLGIFLCVCLLLPYVPTMAASETCKLTVQLNPDEYADLICLAKELQTSEIPILKDEMIR